MHGTRVSIDDLILNYDPEFPQERFVSAGIAPSTTSDLTGRGVEPRPETGLRVRSQAMADKPVTIRRELIGQRIDRPGSADMARLNVALAFVMGLAD